MSSQLIHPPKGMSAMTWTETQRRQEVLREVGAIADVRMDGVLPWSDEYSDAFDGPDDLLRELEYRWRIHTECQLDPHLRKPDFDERWIDLHQRFEGVLRILEVQGSETLDADGRQLAAA